MFYISRRLYMRLEVISSFQQAFYNKSLCRHSCRLNLRQNLELHLHEQIQFCYIKARIHHLHLWGQIILPLREGTGSARTKLFLRRNNPDAVEINGLLKPTGNAGQPANGNLQHLKCQCEIG